MKSVVNENAELQFPKIMQHSHTKCIVMFVDQKNGICLNPGTSQYNKIGTYADDWNAKEFTDFTGSITLSND